MFVEIYIKKLDAFYSKLGVKENKKQHHCLLVLFTEMWGGTQMLA